MQTNSATLVDLETKFWQSMVDNDTDTALGMLAEPSMMVSSHGVMKFDHDAYRKMAEQGAMVLTSFELSDVEVTFPNEKTAIVSYHVKQGMAPRGKKRGSVQEMNDTSTWVQTGDSWQCVLHTETAAEAKKAH